MENLTRDYFIKLATEYPQAIEHFFNWLNEYKKEVEWDFLFGNNNRPWFGNDIDFFDLPYDMQNGIIARFDLEKFNGKKGYEKIMSNEKTRYANLFKDVQEAINNRSIKMN